MKFLSFFLLLASSAFARDVTFAWDKNPEPDIAGYYLMVRETPDGPWTKIGESTTDTTLRIQNFPDKEVTVTAFAFNSAGLVSPPSDELVVPMTPLAPGGLKVKMTISIEVTQ